MEIKKLYRIYDEYSKELIREEELTEQEAMYQSCNGYIVELVEG